MRIVEGLDRLCDALDLAPKKVKALVRAGAPIRVTSSRQGTRYLADMDAVEAWFSAPGKMPATTGGRRA